MLSIWERNSFISYDAIIIGSGIVGLSTAYYLRKKNPHFRILILERGLMPSGASTKNAGFACMGSLSEILDNLTHHTEQEVVELFMLRKKGLQRLHEILTHTQTAYQTNGSYELIFENEKYILDKLDYCNQILFSFLGKNAFQLCNEKIKHFGFAATHSLVENTCEGEIDSGMMMKNFISLVSSLNIEIKTGCMVQQFEDTGSVVNVVCKNPLSTQEIIFNCKKLYICNNAFAKQFLPDEDITPGRGQVMITKPIDNLKFKGIFHFDKGYYYFREYGGAVLFGGGRNIDFDKESTTDFSLNEKIQNDLMDKLRHIILPDTPFEIDMQWSGIMAFGREKKPIIKKPTPHICAGVRMGGMGVAIGSEIGFRLSEIF